MLIAQNLHPFTSNLLLAPTSKNPACIIIKMAMTDDTSFSLSVTHITVVLCSHNLPGTNIMSFANGRTPTEVCYIMIVFWQTKGN